MKKSQYKEVRSYLRSVRFTKEEIKKINSYALVNRKTPAEVIRGAALEKVS